MSDNTNPPAFPRTARVNSDGLIVEHAQEGMTLRDYFAAKAMAIVPDQSAYNMKPKESLEDYTARRAYAFADAMLKRRQA